MIAGKLTLHDLMCKFTCVTNRDLRFGLLSGSDGHQIGQMWDFLRSDFSTFWVAYGKEILRNPIFVSFCANLTHFGPKYDTSVNLNNHLINGFIITRET